MKAIISEVDALVINAKDILQYFVWQGLNHTFQDHLTNITNKNRPDLDEIEANMFEATNRLRKTFDDNKTGYYRRTQTNDNDFSKNDPT